MKEIQEDILVYLGWGLLCFIIWQALSIGILMYFSSPRWHSSGSEPAQFTESELVWGDYERDDYYLYSNEGDSVLFSISQEINVDSSSPELGYLFVVANPHDSIDGYFRITKYCGSDTVTIQTGFANRECVFPPQILHENLMIDSVDVSDCTVWNFHNCSSDRIGYDNMADPVEVYVISRRYCLVYFQLRSGKVYQRRLRH